MTSIDPREWAAVRHGDQRYGTRPYLDHLDDVAELVRDRGSEAVTVAYLHDVVEDTGAGLDDIDAAFGPEIARWVGLVTDPEGENRRVRKARAYARMEACGPEDWTALHVKAADRLANVRACLRDGRTRLLAMYRQEHRAFREAVHRPGLATELWEELDALLAPDPD